MQHLVEIDKPDVPIPPVPIPVPSDWENPANPETWHNMPSNITPEEATQALVCVTKALYGG